MIGSGGAIFFSFGFAFVFQYEKQEVYMKQEVCFVNSCRPYTGNLFRNLSTFICIMMNTCKTTLEPCFVETTNCNKSFDKHEKIDNLFREMVLSYYQKDYCPRLDSKSF
jgi:hypothetical protein